MTTSVNLINQIKQVLNRHSEDPYFGNLVSALQNVSSNSDTISYKAFSYLKDNLNKFDISTVQDIIDTADKAILL